MPRVIHFDIPCADMERAKRFYGAVFGWSYEQYGDNPPYWLVTTGKDEPGIDGGIQQRHAPAQGPYVTIGVPDVDEYLKAVEAKGGKIMVPKMALPGVGWVAYCKDTEGNDFGLYQDDRSAA